MEFIAHRINRIDELKQLDSKYGVELDLRDNFDERIYIEHNPFEPGEDFEEYLKCYKHGTMILNIKSERIEYKCIELLKQYGIEKYFFLDSSFPMIYTLSQYGNTNIALRLSEFEMMDTITEMKGKAQWVWVDCFTRIPVTRKDLDYLCQMGYKTCFVSPELQGRPEDVDKYIKEIEANHLKFDAVCSKIYTMDKWEAAIFDV